MADIFLAAPNAQFGQPEVNIGTTAGGGGSRGQWESRGRWSSRLRDVCGTRAKLPSGTWPVGSLARAKGSSYARPLRSPWRLRGRARLPCRRRRRPSVLVRPLVFFYLFGPGFTVL